MKTVSTNRLAGVRPRIRRRNTNDLRPIKFTFALRWKSAAINLRRIRRSRHRTQRKRQRFPRSPAFQTWCLTMNQSPCQPVPRRGLTGLIIRLRSQSSHRNTLKVITWSPCVQVRAFRAPSHRLLVLTPFRQSTARATALRRATLSSMLKGGSAVTISHSWEMDARVHFTSIKVRSRSVRASRFAVQKSFLASRSRCRFLSR